MKEIKYCLLCHEEAEDNEPICLDCRMQIEAELQEYNERFDDYDIWEYGEGEE